MKTSDCDAVILCGGLGKRLKSVVSEVPKVMAEIDGRPFLDLVIEYLKSQNIARVILCTGYKSDVIEKHYRTHDCGVAIDFSVESEPLGTGGAVKNAQTHITHYPFFVLNGDCFPSADLQKFLDFHKKKEALASVLVSKVKDGQDFGSMILDDDANIVDFQEKISNAAEPTVNAGIYCFEQSIFDQMPEGDIFSLEKDLFPKLVGNQFFGYLSDQTLMDIGTPERYSLAQEKLKKGKTLGN